MAILLSDLSLSAMPQRSLAMIASMAEEQHGGCDVLCQFAYAVEGL